MYEIVIGRQKKDFQKYGTDATIFLGRHYVKMGQHTSLSNNVYLDMLRSHVMFVCGKRGSGKCLTEDTLITLSNGLVRPISQLKNLDAEVLSLNKDLKMELNDKEEFFEREVDKILEITLRTGKKIKLTPEHPILTIEGWKPAEELIIGKRIATPRIQPSFGENNMAEDKVKILAYLIAEGHIGKRIQFTNKDEKIIQDFKSSINNFDKELSIVPNKEFSFFISDYRNKHKFIEAKRDNKGRFTSIKMKYEENSLKKWLKEQKLHYLRSETKFIPDSVFELPKQKLAIFLNRLYSCDGSIYKKKNEHSTCWQLSYCSVSEQLIRQVQHLLSRFGIISRLRIKKTKSKLGIAYELITDGDFARIFIEEIGFFGKKEERQSLALKEMEKRKSNPNYDTIPKELWNHYRPENWAELGRKIGYKHPKALRESIRYAPSRQKLMQIAIHDKREDIELLAKSDIYWDEIINVEEINEKTKVYDISVPETHNFVANDIIVHNSYTLGAIAEGMADLPATIKKNLSILLVDTMGVYWTMKYPNRKESALLNEWKQEAKALDVRIFTPIGYYEIAKKKGIPADVPFALNAALLSPQDWLNAFEISENSKLGVTIQNAIYILKKKDFFSIKDIIKELEKSKSGEAETAISRFQNADYWGVFATTKEEATPLEELSKGGQVGVLDISAYATQAGSWSIKNLVTGIVCKQLFTKRMKERKEEEYHDVHKETGFASKQQFNILDNASVDHPLVWIAIDEAHEFLPRDEKTTASDPLITILREGRQPGISLILATQQPGKIHTDVMTQSDIVLSHRLTAKIDVDALGLLMQSYMREGLDTAIDNLPREHGAALIFDDTNERMFQVKVRPRFTWHGGESPQAIRKKIGL